MKDRRRCDRSRAFLAGTVACGDRLVMLDCVVRDLSDAGALLLIDEPMRAPSQMDLTVGPKGDIRLARVMWRGERAVGVAFLPADDRDAGRLAEAPHNIIPFPMASRGACGDTDRERLAHRIARFVRPASAGRHEPADL